MLTYHVVPGSHDSASLRSAILAGGGKTMLKTVSGGTLTFMMNGSNNIVVRDEKGDVANIVTYDVAQSNGEIFSIDTVLRPAG